LCWSPAVVPVPVTVPPPPAFAASTSCLGERAVDVLRDGLHRRVEQPLLEAVELERQLLGRDGNDTSSSLSRVT
jgi:hypothetical protein